MSWQTCQMPYCNATTEDGEPMCSVCHETQPEKMAKANDKAFGFIKDKLYVIQVEEVGKAQMSDVRIGFEEDPKREIARLKHMGISEEDAMSMYQQYIDSLEHGA